MGLYSPFDEEKAADEQYSEQGASPALTPTSTAPEKPLSFQEHARLQEETATKFNYVASIFDNGIGDWSKKNPNFVPSQSLQGTKYMNYPEYFVNADTSEDVENGKRLVDRDIQQEELAQRAPNTSFWSSMAWGTVDPMLAIPGFGTIKAAKLARTASIASRILTKADMIAARTAVTAGGVSAGVIGAQEAILRQNNPDRTLKESLINVATAGVIGGSIGGLVGKYAGNKIVDAEEAIAARTKLASEAPSDIAPPSISKPESTLVASQTQATDAVKTVLGTTEDEILPDMAIVNKNLQYAQDHSIHQLLDEHNMEGHVSPFMRKWAEEHADPVAEARALVDKKEDDVLLAKSLNRVDKFPDEIKSETPVSNTDSNVENSSPIEANSEVDLSYVPQDTRVANTPNWLLKTISIPGARPPYLIGMMSPSNTVRDLTPRIFESHLPLNYNMEGKATPRSLFSNNEQDMLEALDVNKSWDEQYLRYLQVEPDSKIGAVPAFFKSHKFSNGGKFLTRKDFDSEVMGALNNGDRHSIPEVQQVAQYLRGVYNKAFKRAQDVGYFKDMEPMKDWSKFVYNIPEIIRNRVGFESALTSNFMKKSKAVVTVEKDGKVTDYDAVYDSMKKEVDFVPKPGQTIKSVKVGAAMDQSTAKSLSRDTSNKILKMGDKELALGDIQRLNFELGSDSMQARKLTWDYDDVKPFLVQDLKKITHNYLSGMSRMVNGKKLLDDLKINNFNDLRIRVRNEFTAKQDKINTDPALAPKEKTKLVTKLQYQAQQAERELNDTIAIGLGQYHVKTRADAFFRTVDQYNAIRMLPGVTVSSLADSSLMFFKDNIPNVLWNGFLGDVRRIFSGTFKLKNQDMRDALTAIQDELDDGIKFLMNPEMEPFGSHGPIESSGRSMGKVANKINLMQYWMNFNQRASHSIMEARLLRDLAKGWNKISKKEQAYLAEHGIDEPISVRIMAQQNKFGENVRGTHISNTRLWEPEYDDARRAFLNAVRLEVKTAPVLSGPGDLPKIVQKYQAVKTAFLFKSYLAASTTKILASMLARRDARQLVGLTALLLGGMQVYILKEKLAGREPNYDLKHLLMGAYDKTGIGGLMADPMVQIMYARQNIAKYGDRAWYTSPLEYLAGPSSSIINPVYNGIIKTMAGQEIDPKTAYQLKALIPYYNAGFLGRTRNPKKSPNASSRYGVR